MSALLGFYLRILHSPGPRGRVVAFFFITSLGYETVRMLVFTRPLHWQVAEPDSVLILGSGPRASKAWRELRTRHHDEKRLAGFIDDRDPDMMAPDVAARYLGKVDSLANILLNNVIDELIVAMPMRSCYALIQNAISLAEDAGVRVLCLNDFYCLAHNKKLRLRASLLTELVPRNHGVLFAELLKRIIDVTCAFAGLLLCIPLFIVIAASIKATSRGPVFFRQERFGYRRRHFRICKFRSMVCDADKLLAALEGRNEATGPIFKIRKDPRVTPLGRFLRRTSLDELPQLWNVLIGDMSLHGGSASAPLLGPSRHYWHVANCRPRFFQFRPLGRS
jgi:lipopolysaccharide/colanic/teichoic acid biosynthesis glycosyltransferase